MGEDVTPPSSQFDNFAQHKRIRATMLTRGDDHVNDDQRV
jgi:hypothetical protein